MLKKVTLAAGASAVALLLASAANAATYEYNFSGGNSPTSGSNGNTRVFSSTPLGGPNVTASAFYATGTSSALGAAYLGHYDHGLGVTNPGALFTPDGQHEVDNDGYIDLVLFQFAQAIDVNSITLRSFGDADIQVWFGNTFVNNSINGDFGLTDLGIFTCNGSAPNGECDGDNDNNPTEGQHQTYNVNAGNLTGTYLLIAARPSNGDNDEDKFKIKEIEFSYNPPTTNVSEPGTLAAFGIGLAALGYLGRRRKAA